MGSTAELEKVLDPRERPPESIKAFYKRYQKASLAAIDSDPNVLDLARQLSLEQSDKVKIVGHVHADTIKKACSTFGGFNADQIHLSSTELPIHECKCLPGKCV